MSISIPLEARHPSETRAKWNTIYRLYACLKAICNVKRSIRNLFFKSSFSERMIQVASTGKENGNEVTKLAYYWQDERSGKGRTIMQRF